MIAVQHARNGYANGAALAPSPLAGSRLRNSPLLSREERLALDGAVLPVRTVTANVDLVREGERPEGLFIVTEGWVCRYSTTREGGRQVSALLVPGDVANVDALMFDRADESIRSLSKACVAVLPRDRAASLAAEHPGIARTFARLAMVENTILGRWALSLGRKHAIERLAHLFCELSVRLGAEDGNRSCFGLPLTQEHLADTLGLTSVHVNRMMQQLRADGLIATSERIITLLDVAALRRIGGFDPRYLHVDGPVARIPA